MRAFRLRSLLGVVLLCTLLGAHLGCGGGSTGASSTPAPPTPPQDILLALQGRPELANVVESPSPFSGTRFFTFALAQPLDHHVSGGERFPQTLTLLYRSAAAPTVLATSGYDIPRTPSQGELTRILQANQLTMEHRFFATSVPATVDWTKLDIWQSANDEHRVVTTLKPLLSGPWLTTGASKGGMTAVYHRRFFPADVDATVAYVAPNSFGDTDPRYIPFLAARGTSADWTAIDAWQQAVLDHWADVKAIYQARVAAGGNTLNLLGADKTLELALLEAPFTLWQYGNASLAAQVPGAGATAQDLYDYLDATSFGLADFWNDATLTWYQAYYYQASTQLGYPAVREDHLTGLPFAHIDAATTYPPTGIAKPFDAAPMHDVQDWVSTSATHVMFIYGENDPYTGAAFDLPAAAQARGNHLYIVPGGNHGARISQLPDPQKTQAYTALSQWMHVPVQPVAPSPAPGARSKQPHRVDLEETYLFGRRPR